MQSWKTFSYFTKSYPLRGLVMVLCLVVAGFLEGIGVVALLPLVSIMTEQSDVQSGLVFEIVETTFNFLNLEINIASILGFIVGSMLLKALITMIAMAQVSYSSSRVCANLRLTYLRNILKSNWSHVVQLRSGASANALGTEAYRASMSFRQGCYVIAWSVQVVVYALLSFFISWRLTLAAIAVGAIMVFLLSFLVREGRRAGQEQTDVLESVLTKITDTLFAAKPLKAMGKEERLLSMMEEDTQKLKSAQRRMEISDQAITVMSEPIMVVFIAIGIYAILSFGDLDPSELLFLALLFLRMIMKVSSVQKSYLSMASNESALWSLQKKIDAASANGESSNGDKTPTLKKGISFKDISFSYGDSPVLNNISFDLPANGLYVLCGPSGEGKTTLLDLMLGLHQPSTGSVYIDGTPLEDIEIEKWRHMIGYVPQDVLLFHDTIRNNVTLNDENITTDEIIDALKTADAWEFVEKSEEALETIVGEHGAKLSGGQRQRIAIARAIVQKPSVLILDEATSALDRETTKSIWKTVKSLSKDILVLSISHNPDSFSHADKIFRLQNSKLEELPSEQINE